MKNTNKKTVICLVGPTAVGKTEVALKLAKRIGAEIVSCDSMQVYQGADIASCKPTKRQRAQIRHHLIDIKKPAQQYNAARFSTACRKIIRDIHQRGKTPLIVGGTGLYLRVLLEGIFIGPGENVRLRKKLYQEAKTRGVSFLYQRLKKVDPRQARAVHAHDLRRIVRALEVYELTGKPISKLKQNSSGIKNRYEVRIFGLQRPRPELYARIEKRVERMFARGLVAEIKALSQKRLSRTAKGLLGYKEITGYLQGKYSSDEARELLKQNTRRYAKRQVSWFKAEKDVQWIDIGAKDTPAIVAERIINEL